MMRAGVILCMAGFLVAGCGGGVKAPQHAGQKGKPWEKAKALKLEKNVAKADADLDYGRYKRAKWFAVTLPNSGQLEVDMEVTPGGPGGATDDESEEELDMDVGLEIIDGASFAVLSRSDLESDDAHNLKKQQTLKQLPEGRYLIHVYLQGRLDSADVELKLAFTEGDLPRKTDFPNQVAWVDSLAAVPPVDDSPQATVVKKKKVVRIKTTTATTATPEPDTGGGSVMAEISDVQPEGAGTKITIAGGISDGLANGLSGSISGVRNTKFKLSGCGPSTCRASVKAPPEDVRGASNVIIKLK